MKIETAIIKYWGKEEMLPIVKYIGSNQERYDIAMTLMLNPNKQVHQKAAWVIQHSSEKYPWLLNKHVGDIIKNLFKENLHDSVKRATLRSLDLIEIPEEYRKKIRFVPVRNLSEVLEVAIIGWESKKQEEARKRAAHSKASIAA